MDHSSEENGSYRTIPDSPPLDENARHVILAELDLILKSRWFKSSNRSKQFLSYVVRNSMEGHAENLKERTIGIEVFERDPDYATGENPVVRISAGEVRRRLEQYYHDTTSSRPVHIEIPRGSYIPEFRWPAHAEPSGDLSGATTGAVPAAPDPGSLVHAHAKTSTR
jgi:hypothetical protein